MTDELTRLRETNAELLEALKAVIPFVYVPSDDDSEIVAANRALLKANDAMAKAES